MIALALAVPCVATCIFETLALCFFKDGKRRMLPQLVCNILTNPTLHILLAFGGWVYTVFVGGESVVFNAILLILLEVGVVFLEAGVCGFFIREPFQKRLKISLLLNAVSFLLGLLLNQPLENLIRSFI